MYLPREPRYSMHKAKVDIVSFQETHFKTGCIPTCSDHYNARWYHSSDPVKKASMVSISIHKNLPIAMVDQMMDPKSRFLFLILSIWNRVFAIANVYLLNNNQVPTANAYLSQLQTFASGTTNPPRQRF